jgi:cytosine/adenosine deaminase-related metal-dependent hydrolase
MMVPASPTFAPPAPTTAAAGRWLLSGLVSAEAGPAGHPGSWELVVEAGVIRELRPAEGEHRSGLVLVPLFVNAHDHGRGAGNVLAGIADAPLELWLDSLEASGGTARQAELIGDAARAMLASGVGAAVFCVNPQSEDVAGEVLVAAQVASEIGIRAAVVYPLADAKDERYGRRRALAGWTPSEVQRRLAEVEEIAAAVERPGLEVQLGPVGPQWVSEATLVAVADHSRETGRRVHLHLLESRAQRRWADETYPEGIVTFLERIGLLGPHACCAHGTQLRSEELLQLRSTGCVLAVNASSNLRLASGIPPVADAAATVEALGIGLDGLALGDDADYWTELRLVRGLWQAQLGARVPADELFARACRTGQAALGAAAPSPPRVGSVADFALVDVSKWLHLLEAPGWGAAEVALAAAGPEQVREVWVNGRRVHATEAA